MKDLKDARTNKRANEIANELGYEDADDLKDSIDAGATDIVTVNKAHRRCLGAAPRIIGAWGVGRHD